jgi:ABC-type molybdenum transport system ATPase subunit/photorepair protein PhrA
MNIVESTDNAEENVKDNVIQFQVVKCRISGKDILRVITLNVKRGEFMGIRGKNGVGKTTLLSLISGLRSLRDSLRLHALSFTGAFFFFLIRISFLFLD